MPTKHRQISMIVDDDAFRVLALEPGRNGDGATQIRAALARYADHIGRAAREMEKILTRAEWNALADVLNGCADLWDLTGTPLSHLLLIRAEIEDGHRLDGLGHKWFGDGAAGDKGIKTLLAKLAKLTDLHGDAIAAAVRYFSSHTESIDHNEHPWWSLAYRTRSSDAAATA
jgi:hypothetical protein